MKDFDIDKKINLTNIIKNYPDTSPDQQKELLRSGGAFIMTEDISGVLNRIPGVSIPQEVTDRFTRRVRTALSNAFRQSLVISDECTFYGELDTKLARVLQEARAEGSVVVNFDRFIVNPYLGPENYATLSGGRLVSPEAEILGPRPGDPPIQEQIDAVNALVSRLGTDTVTFVDDGLATIEALEPYIRIAEDNDWTIKRFLLGVGPSGDGEWDSVTEANRYSQKPALVVLPVTNPTDWVCERDFTLFGGKMIDTEGNLPASAPYIFPFTDGASASLPAAQLQDISRDILIANQEILQVIDRGRQAPLLFSDALTAGYGLPISLLGEVRMPDPDESMSSFIGEILINI